MLDFRSLRFRVGAAVFGLGFAVWLAGGLITVWLTRQEAREALEGQLQRFTELVVAMPTEEFEEYKHALATQAPNIDPYAPRTMVVVRNRAGRVIFTSEPPDRIPEPPREVACPHRREIAGKPWRECVLQNERTGHLVYVAARQELGDDFVEHVAIEFARSGIVIIPILFVLAWLATHGALADIERLSFQVARRDPHALTPIDARLAPPELKGLVGAINDLADRYATALAEMQRFTADAAHELRTPLATIHTHAQVALGEPSDDWRRMSLEQIEGEAARTARMLDQLLKLARLNHADLNFTRERTSLRSLSRLMAGTDERIRVRADEDVAIDCISGLVDLALRNLVTNALNHGAGRVMIFMGTGTVERRAGRSAWIAVEDDGTGIPPDLRERVFEPFYRLADARHPGSGLGLSIVRRVAAVHGGMAWVEGAHHLKGARFVMAFPALP